MVDAFGSLCLQAGLLSCVLLLLFRSLHREPLTQPVFAACLAGSLLLLSGIAFLQSRRRFVSIEEACTRLDASLGLHNALTTARQGLRAWPAIPLRPWVEAPDGLRWNWPNLAIPPLLGVLLTIVPVLLPFPKSTPAAQPPNKPMAWETMESSLDKLAEKQIADPEAVRELQEALRNLEKTPTAEWFRDSTLEATDSLEQSMNQGFRELEMNLSQAARALSALENSSASLSEADRHALQAQLAQAVEGLSNSKLPLHPSQLEALRHLDPSALSSDPSASRALGESLRQNAQSLRELMEQSDALRDRWEKQLQADQLLGQTDPGSFESMPGQGAPTRGPGEAPLRYEDQPVDLKTHAPERISGLDPSRAAAGDLLGVDNSKPGVKAVPSVPGTAGAVSGSGQGGHEIWESTLLPSERTVLRKYFR